MILRAVYFVIDVFFRIESDLLQLCEKYIKDFNLEDELKKTEAGLDNLAKVTIIHSRLVIYDSLLKAFHVESDIQWNPHLILYCWLHIILVDQI